MIDLRSDTLTRPTESMRQAMARAEVGDDVYGEDPTVRVLEERVAGLFGHEAALFTPTGSMANVLAVRSLVGPGQEVLCEASAHIARAELGAHGAYTGLTMRTWIVAARRRSTWPTIQQLFAPDMGPFFVPTVAISVENTHNFAGGAVLPLDDLQELRDVRRLGRRHACTWTAPGSGTRTSPPASRSTAYGAIADVMSVCLSKGLGAPIGSLMVGSADAIAEARVWRKRMGGGMRQVGILAAAGLHALDHHVDRLADDHAHARLLAEACGVDPATRRHQHRGRSRTTTRRRSSPPRARKGSWSARSARPPSAWSPTSTCPATTPSAPPRCSPASEQSPEGADPPPSTNGDPRLECRSRARARLRFTNGGATTCSVRSGPPQRSPPWPWPQPCCCSPGRRPTPPR